MSRRDVKDCKDKKPKTGITEEEEQLLKYLDDGLKEDHVVSNSIEMLVAEGNKEEFKARVSVLSYVIIGGRPMLDLLLYCRM